VATDVNARGNRVGEPPNRPAEAELSASGERMKVILSSLPDLIFRVDREGTFIDFHAPSLDQLAVPPEKFLGKRLSDVLPGEIARESLRIIAETLRDGGISPVQEYRLDVKGHPSDFEARFARCGTDEVIAIIRDITGKKRAEEMIRKSEERNRQVEKFEAIGRLTSGLAHHLNNLMTVVTGYSELLLTQVPQGDPRHGEIVKIRAAGERAAELIRQLLAFSRLQVLRPREVDLTRFVSQLSGTLKDIAGRYVRFTFSPGENAGKIQVDPDHLRQALTQLVANARDAMPGGGELRLSTASAELKGPVEGIETAPGRYALLAVQDSGCGMDAETRSRVFEPFYSLKTGSEGMGLPSVYGFVKQSGGYVFVDSRPGHGTTFRLYFPCIDWSGDLFARSGPPPAGTPNAG